jgi:hypothetical protein
MENEKYLVEGSLTDTINMHKYGLRESYLFSNIFDGMKHKNACLIFVKQNEK